MYVYIYDNAAAEYHRHLTPTLDSLCSSDLQRLFPAEDLAQSSILLAVTEAGQPCFTAELPGGASVAGSAQAALGGKFVDPRAALFLLPWEEACAMSHVSRAWCRLD